MGQFLTLKNMVTKFFQNSNFSDFLGIKSEISQWLGGYDDKNIEKNLVSRYNQEHNEKPFVKT